MDFDFAGTYTEIVARELIECNFGGPALGVEFLPEKDGVRILETFDAQTRRPEEQQHQGWQAILNSFAKYVEAMQGD